MPTSSSKPCFGVSKRKIWKNPSKMALFELMLNWLKWREKGPKPIPSPFKVALCKLRYKTTILHFWYPVFWTPIFDLQTKMLICSALIDGPQNRPQNPKTLVKPFKFLLKVYIYHFWALCMHCKKDDYDSMLFWATYDLFSGFTETVDLYPLFWCTFSKFRDFWWFWTILIEKWTFWTLWGTSNSLLSKSHDISAFSPMDPLKTC